MLENLSFWEKSTYLEGIDFAVVGSGIVGLTAAITFKERYPKAKVIVIERGVFPSGASTKNAGFACFGSVSELLEDLETMGTDAVLSLVAQRWRGLQRLRERCGDEQLDFQAHGGYELFLQESETYKECARQIPFLNEKLASIIGGTPIFTKEENVNKFGFGKVKNIIFNRFEGQINPAKMMGRLRFLANELGIQILTGLTITNLVENKDDISLEIAKAKPIKVAKVLVATNGFTKKILPNIALQPARNQVLITEPIPNLKLKGTFHFDQGYYYFRNFENRVLLGGARNQAKIEETTHEFGLTPLIQDTLMNFLTSVILPNQPFEIAYRWSGILGVGNQKAPIVQKHGAHIGVAVRLGGMGVAIGSLVGEEGAKLFM
ncbi:MAG: NAD(P)/FAD-dependent oxidoreductase [Saprospiraceae bacterium]